MRDKFLHILIMVILMNILITGGASGIARKVIEKLGEKHQIYVTVHTEKQLELITKKYQDKENIQCLKLDVTNKEDRKKVTDINIDVFISNAAIGYSGSMFEIPISLVKENFEVNVFGNLELTQLVVKRMIQKKKGRIIFISSLAGNAPIPFLGSYCATKASINMISSTMRLEAKLLKSKIEVITIQPGLYQTGFNQVMIENKFDRMNLDTYFKEQLEFLKKYETPLYHLLETKKLDSITNKIVDAATKKNPRKIYRTRISQILFTKMYQIFFT